MAHTCNPRTSEAEAGELSLVVCLKTQEIQNKTKQKLQNLLKAIVQLTGILR